MAELTLATGFDPAQSVVSGTVEGARSASQLSSGCAGAIADAPTLVLHATEAFGSLELLVSSDSDTVLVVQHPDGSFACDDDSGGQRNPRIATAFASGDHQVWVGTYQSGSRASFELRFREGTASATPAASAGSTTPAGPFVGSVTVENRTSAPICRIECDAGPEYASFDVSIPAGATGSLQVSRTMQRLWFVGCDGRVLFGAPNPDITSPSTSQIEPLDVGTITLLEAGSAPTAEAGHRVLVAEPRTAAAYLHGVVEGLARMPSDALNTPTLRTEAFAALQQGGRERRWPETFVALRMVSSDWNIARHRLSGVITRRIVRGVSIARYPSGLCQATLVSIAQQHDGRDFSGALSFSDIGGSHQVPCAIADEATRSSGWAH
jgi:hypothetical protein